MLSVIYFWDHRTVYIGRLPDIGEHRLASAALVVGLEKDFRITDPESGQGRSCRSALIPPGFNHESSFSDALVALVSLEPESNDYPIVKQLMELESFGCYFDLGNERQAVHDLYELYTNQPDATESLHIINALLYAGDLHLQEPKPIDKRIRRAMEIVRDDPAESYSLETLADRVHLSATRLTHLFKEETGVPIRRYRQWLRFRLAIQYITTGKTMTVAATRAGFSDSAHFSRAFRTMFGIKPSVLFRKSNPVRTFVS